MVRRPALVVLKHDGAWSGFAESFALEQASWRPGEIDLRLGPHSLTWQDGRYRMRLRGSIGAELELSPLVIPSIPTSVRLTRKHDLHWTVLPRLQVHGWVTSGTHRTRVDAALGYHDHNWGTFQWGRDLTWEWGYVNPDDASCPFSLVLLRVRDFSRKECFSHSLLVWCGHELVRTFSGSELEITLSGLHRSEQPFTLPAPAALLLPGTSAGVPARVSVKGAGLGDWLELEYETSTKARLVVPSDVDAFGTVKLKESCGSARVAGQVGGAAFEFSAAAMMEFAGA